MPSTVSSPMAQESTTGWPVFCAFKNAWMFTDTSALDRSLPCRPPPVTDCAISEPTVAAVSVVPAEVKEKEETAKFLADTLELDYDDVLEKVQQKVALVRIQSKVDTETAQAIRQADLPGVKVDEDVQRIYPFGELAAQVVGFVGKDNQGIIGLEAKYDDVLEGEQGKY